MKKLLLVPGALLAAANAFAVGTPVDVAGVTDAISAQLTPIGLVGVGVLAVIVAIATYKWVRRAI